MSRFAVHNSPAWGWKSNFIFQIDLVVHDMPGRLEQFWGRRVANDLFEVCCIPFFTYGFSLGDVLKVDLERNRVIEVFESYGHQTLRICADSPSMGTQLHILLHEWVASTGLLYEWYADGYLVVDLPPGEIISTEKLDTLVSDEKIFMEWVTID
jgi:Domain of unknown function (DUF4265)